MIFPLLEKQDTWRKCSSLLSREVLPLMLLLQHNLHNIVSTPPCKKTFMMRTVWKLIYFVSMYIFLYATITSFCAADVITSGHSINDGGSTLVSPDGSFELGFFSLDDSLRRYLGIWYRGVSVRTVVWVANRDDPISGPSGALILTSLGVLVLRNRTGHVFWSSNTTPIPKVRNVFFQLLDSGNLVVKEGSYANTQNILWQSFDLPCDTLLPGMKLGRNLVTNQDMFLTSWKSDVDPAPGDYSGWIDANGYPQLLVRKGTQILFRAGPWNGIRFSGSPWQKKNPVYNYEFVLNENEVYYTYQLVNSSVLSRLIMNKSGHLERFVWVDQTDRWLLYLSVPVDNCDNYGLCGAYATCNIEGSPICECLKGFVPKSLRDWSMMDWTGGCVRRTKLQCEGGDGFLKYSGIKLPDTSFSWFNTSMSLHECEQTCLRNCSCSAYANTDIRGAGSGCLLWFNDLIDIREFSNGGQDIYIRMAASELGHIPLGQRKSIIISTVVSCILITVTGVLLLTWKRKCHKQESTRNKGSLVYADQAENDESEVPMFAFGTLATATNNFSSLKKLGQGGFGAVYKGTLMNGKDIAVKRFSRSSRQGLIEFKNEVCLIAKLQHRNLVRLLGYCMEGDERLLIYEFMPNGSLDCFVHGQRRSELTDWRVCFHIIGGIARGLLYLHEDSRLRIIHRDLKSSNVLLDTEMNPKISDFGLAKIFGVDQNVANTTRIVGTFGYMPPEYAVDGLCSVKFDVFSFGVLVLEIVSGKKNRGFRHPDHEFNLLGHAWNLWMEERPLDLVDGFDVSSCDMSQVIRCIHVALLCVQKLPEDRPSSSAVVLMLGSDSLLPQPKQPGFYTQRNPLDPETQTRSGTNVAMDTGHSQNEVTCTSIEPR